MDINTVLVPAQPQQPAPAAGFGELKLVITGWPRSGTQWLAKSINNCGVLCGLGNDEIFYRTWDTPTPIQVEVSGFAAPYTDALHQAGIPVAVVTRHPIKLFASIWGKWQHGRLRPDHNLDYQPGPAIAVRWLQTMRHLHQAADLTLQIERLWENPTLIPFLLCRYGFHVPFIRTDEIAATYNPVLSTASDPPVVLGGSMTPGVIDLAWKLGYDPDSFLSDSPAPDEPPPPSSARGSKS